MYIAEVTKGLTFKDMIIHIEKGKEVTNIELAKAYPQFIKEISTENEVKDLKNVEETFADVNVPKTGILGSIKRIKKLFKR